ncbi:RIB43A-like with coiled-coils protein 2 [Hypanus sabinus]|uniref:RIB43A-like with coiled-coils protein 2 n=1 Tax=Hypanus sabinus TaxID=79690 RepID=UPI0028C3770D|nr:RIB43A-like with coiled-coils protein 2 [Hypanus sabinus]XP_059834002.1 RIB43A-like with coiled-coils protein 2 [Hypanus sabinus]
MHKLDGPVDLKEAAIIARRRDVEVQRKNRVFNTRVRTIGIDQQALDAQVQDRKLQEGTEASKHAAYAKDLIRHDQTMCLLDERYKHDMINLNKAISEFRLAYQKPETRREFDLNDPQALKKDVPARISDNDPRCTVSSIQMFTGEDLNRQERIRRQQEQIREWSFEQQQELKNALEEQKLADKFYDKNRTALDRRVCELQQMEEDTRRAVTVATKDFNRAQATEKATRQKLEEQNVQEDNLIEIENHLHSDLLTENPKQALSAFGPNRVIVDRWKGMTQDQVDDIIQKQKQQVQERKRLEEEERQRNAEWDRLRINDARASVLLERHQQRVQRQLRKEMDCQNMLLCKNHKERERFLKNEVYVNVPTAKYFDQFNTTSR